ncbi:MAG: ActD-like protein, partial [Myxococcota bacterium]
MNDNKTETTQTPDWVLERLLLGELPPAQMTQLQARLEVEPGLKERLRALEADNAATLEILPPPHVAREVHRRQRLAQARADARSSQPQVVVPWWMPALAGAAAM